MFKMLKNLFSYGFHNQSFDRLESYLSVRYQCTKVNETLSDCMKEDVSGFCVGTLTFIVYIKKVSIR